MSRPLSAGQVLQAGDVTARRVLADSFDQASPTAKAEHLVGQVLAKDMKRGEAIVAASVKPAPLVLKDQFVTVSIPHQGMTIETVARALETGAKGDNIRAKNEATGQILKVTVTAPAAGQLASTDP